MSDLDKLITARSQIVDRIVEITLSANPNYSIDGQSVSKADYLDTLTSQLKKLDEIIAAGSLPMFEMTQGFT